MTATVLPAVALLERAVGYTRGTLAGVTPAHLGQPTPCRGWDLHQLLVHMDDSLDAFIEASTGHVVLEPGPSRGPVLERIREKACRLLGAWAEPPGHDAVAVGDRRLATDLLVCAGALEIVLHGWDVGEATGHPSSVPEELAQRLLPVAHRLIGPDDRPVRFGPVIPSSRTASHADRLMAYSGRHP